jgi:hypothetical protein
VTTPSAQESSTCGNFKDAADAVVVLGRTLDVLECANPLPHRFALPRDPNNLVACCEYEVSVRFAHLFWRDCGLVATCEFLPHVSKICLAAYQDDRDIWAVMQDFGDPL